MMNTNDKIILVTGGFDPLHSGHIEYIKEARKLGRVIIGVNSDEWLIRKKKQAFMPFEERINIVSNLKNVMLAIGFDDSDGSAKDAIIQVRKLFPKNTIIFANGGDRTKENIPEMDIKINNLEFLFGVGGDYKKNSSSWILSEWKHPSEVRTWGKFITYYTSEQAKLKRLIISPGKSISMQYHQYRSEFWFIESGQGEVFTMINNTETLVGTFNKHDTYHIKLGDWHRLKNNTDVDLVLIETQYGRQCVENDIIRI